MHQKTEDRLSVRIPTQQKALIKRAAELEGMSLTDFVARKLADIAKETIKERETMTLRGADALAFAEALLNPPPPNKALLEADRDYRLMVEERLER
jgi:uncharacterized protein (DUF1778 family)